MQARRATCPAGHFCPLATRNCKKEVVTKTSITCAAGTYRANINGKQPDCTA